MKFLVGFNGKEAAWSVLTVARNFAECFGAHVVVAISMGGGRGETFDEISKAEEDLAAAEQFLKDKNISCEVLQLARGFSPGEDLVRFAEENEVDHIFVGIHKKSRTEKLILGSVAQYVILKAPCPVITAKRISEMS